MIEETSKRWFSMRTGWKVVEIVRWNVRIVTVKLRKWYFWVKYVNDVSWFWAKCESNVEKWLWLTILGSGRKMVWDEVKRNIWRRLDPIDWVTVMTRASDLWIIMVDRMKVKFVRRSVYCRLAPTYWRPDKRKVLKRLRNWKWNDEGGKGKCARASYACCFEWISKCITDCVLLLVELWRNVFFRLVCRTVRKVIRSWLVCHKCLMGTIEGRTPTSV